MPAMSPGIACHDTANRPDINLLGEYGIWLRSASAAM
jgi:hypothetical protein